MFSHSFYHAAVAIDRTCIFPVRFSSQKCTYMYSTPCLWQAWGQGCPSAAGWTQAAVCATPYWAHGPSRPRTLCSTLCTDHQSQPSSCSLEGKMWVFSFSCTSPVGKRLCTSSLSPCGAGLLLARQGGTDISTFTHRWRAFWFHRR